MLTATRQPEPGPAPLRAASPHWAPGGTRNDLWSLPTRSCVSDTVLPELQSAPGDEPTMFGTCPDLPGAHGPFQHHEATSYSCWRTTSTLPAWQLLMRRMVAKNGKRALSQAVSARFSGYLPDHTRRPMEAKSVASYGMDSSCASNSASEDISVFDPLSSALDNAFTMRSPPTPDHRRPESAPHPKSQCCGTPTATSLEVIRLIYIDTAAVSVPETSSRHVQVTIQRIWRGKLARDRASALKLQVLTEFLSTIPFDSENMSSGSKGQPYVFRPRGVGTLLDGRCFCCRK